MADATWYGSFRGMVHSKDGHATMQSNGSQWGVKGSNEVSEGLTAVYRYEENLDLGTASLKANNRLSYVGLSGGFGTITMGRIWTASYNHAGALTDNGVGSTNSGFATLRESNMVSYSASAGPVNFQLDLQMLPSGDDNDEPKEYAAEDKFRVVYDADSSTVGNQWGYHPSSPAVTADPEASIDAYQFGMTFDAGIGTIGLAYLNVKKQREHTDLGSNGKDAANSEPDATQKDLTKILGGDKQVTAVAFSVPVGGVSLHAGYHVQETELDGYTLATGNTRLSSTPADAAKQQLRKYSNKEKKTLLGVSGSLGDTGLSFAVNVAETDRDNSDGNRVLKKDSTTDYIKQKDTTTWNANITKSMGGGASVSAEFIDNGKKANGEKEEDEFVLQLRVDF